MTQITLVQVCSRPKPTVLDTYLTAYLIITIIFIMLSVTSNAVRNVLH